MRERLRSALSRVQADYAEVRFEDVQMLDVLYQSHDLDSMQRKFEYGCGVRVLKNGTWGFSSCNDLGELDSALRRAAELAEISSRLSPGKVRLADVSVIEDRFAPSYTLDPRGITLAEKVRVLERYRQQMLSAHPLISGAPLRYHEESRNWFFANSEGSYIEQEKMDLQCRFYVEAHRDGSSATHTLPLGSSQGWERMLGREAELDVMCREVVEMLDAPSVTAGVYPVICSPLSASVFVHEAFGHFSEADMLGMMPGVREEMKIGRRLAGDHLTIFDSGEYFNGRGALKYDDEGVLARPAYLIQNGVLVGRLHSRETAAAFGEAPTGSARAASYAHPPIVRMRNTCIAPGDATTEEMLADIELGVYLAGNGSGAAGDQSFTFSAKHARMIRDGRLAEWVRGVSLSGSVFDFLRRIDKVGSDWRSAGSGECVKMGQGISVSMTCPSIRIQNSMIGGAR